MQTCKIRVFLFKKYSKRYTQQDRLILAWSPTPNWRYETIYVQCETERRCCKPSQWAIRRMLHSIPSEVHKCSIRDDSTAFQCVLDRR